MKMIAVKPHTYGGKVIQADEEFDVDDKYAPTLISLGRARPADARTTKTRPTTTESKDEPKEEPKAKEESYSTRRLKAKE